MQVAKKLEKHIKDKGSKYFPVGNQKTGYRFQDNTLKELSAKYKTVMDQYQAVQNSLMEGIVEVLCQCIVFIG